MATNDDGGSRLAALAAACGPLSYLERAFVRAASAVAPASPASVERNAWGYLVLRWDAPAPDIGSLWATITPAEVVLSTQISHRHFDKGEYRAERRSGRWLKLRIGRDAAEAAAQVLDGTMCDTISYDAEGVRFSNGWLLQHELTESLSYSRKVFGTGTSMRAWNWFGEVNVG